MDCTAFRRMRLEQATAALRGYFQEARDHAPCVVVLDDVDIIAPAAADGGAAASQGAALTEVISDELVAAHAASDGVLRATAALAHAQGAGSAGSAPNIDSWPVEVRQTAAAIATSGAVAVVASCRNAGDVHASLRRPGLLDCTVSLDRPTAPAREAILRALCDVDDDDDTMDLVRVVVAAVVVWLCA